LYPLDLSSAHENINNLDNLVECFFGTDRGDLGRVGAGSIRMSPIGTGWGAAEMDWHAVLLEQPNRRKLWFPESKVTFNPSPLWR
jgi:hypothetical protein